MERDTKAVRVGALTIGGGAPIVVQSMTNLPAVDTGATIEQIASLAELGCELIRVAVPDLDVARKLNKIVSASPIPVCADIHFDWRIAMEALNQGVSKLRLNPGNLQRKERLKDITELASQLHVPIRIGVNSGSLHKELLKKYGAPTAEALVESASNEVEQFERLGFTDIVISIKSSSPEITIKANRLLHEKYRYPLHLGLTEAGTLLSGAIKSTVTLAPLLRDGIGDTIRISLTASPKEEVKAAWELLKAMQLRKRGVSIISCPGCGRTAIDIYSLAEKVERALTKCNATITVAVMGCVVNGPGEAREADYGIAGGKGEGLIFKKGKIVKKVPESELTTELIEEIEKDLGRF